MDAPPNREVALFSAALELPAGQHGAYLDGACADDPALRSRLDRLLRVHEEAITFLENKAPGAQESPIGAEVPGATMRLSGSPAEKAGDRIGRYKLLQQIGEGGCGVVYMAEQEEPVRRRVALKVIKLGMDTKQVIARFEAERQALALMDHPNIAKVFDAGATETGRPYFVMELVRGVRITDYCDEASLSTRERLDLFIEVCQAIQHAHQKGIIHRDIKPSNILVTVSEPGAPGSPKVIDFGIAKATTGQRLTDKTVFTAFEQFIGTPVYMSPEQAMMTSLDIDTRTDIYSLGVLLYELLTGKTPLDQKELLAAGLEEMRRTIREQEPMRPSTRLSAMLAADLTTVARHRQVEPASLGSLVRGDLDWIVMKCLEKDRARRYETANGLAMDVQRYLADEPVVARPPGNFYRFQKLVRRNKLAVAAAGAVAAALIIGSGVSTWLLFQERTARRRAVAAERDQFRLRQQAQAAELSARTVSEVRRLNNQALLLLQLGDVQQATATAQDALDAARRVPNGGAEVAETLVILAALQMAQDHPVEAERLARDAIAQLGKIFPKDHPKVATATIMLVRSLKAQGKRSEAETIQREAPDVARRILGQEEAAFASAKERAQSIICATNLKQIELAIRLWAMDHDGELPFGFNARPGGIQQLASVDSDGFDKNPAAHFLLLSNELSTPVILVCPADSKQPAPDWPSLQPANVSYQMRSGANTADTNSPAVLVVCPIHGKPARSHGTPKQY